MTAVNIIAGAVYTKGFPVKDKLQLYGIAALFLVLLYNSPSGLVLYWTCNNIFSLGKNIVHKLPISKKNIYIIYIIIIAIIAGIDTYLAHINYYVRMRRILALFMLAIFPFIPLLIKTLCKTDARPPFKYFLFSCISLFLLAGIIIPSSIAASSVEEFSFIGAFSSPFLLLLPPLLQALGIFLFWPIVLYTLFPESARSVLSFFALLFLSVSLTDTFLVNENFGFLNNMMIFSEAKPIQSQNARLIALSFALPLAASAVVFALWKRGFLRVIWGAQCIFLIALTALSVMNTARIGKDYAVLLAKKDGGGGAAETIYTFSKNEKNVLLIMLDAVSAGYIPYIFEEKSELLNIFKDFTFYPNTISYANHTLIGALPLYGGYEYTPKEVNARRDVPLLDKQKEAYLLLPTLFADAGFSVTVTDPPFENYLMSNLKIFENDKRIHAENVIGKYTARWRQTHPEVEAADIGAMLRERFIRFSFFKILPLITRAVIYDKGDWMIYQGGSNTITPFIVNAYSTLDMLQNITSITETGGGSYNRPPRELWENIKRCVIIHIGG